MKTKEYPDNDEVVISEIEVKYAQSSEVINDTEDNLKLSICHQGAGFYFVMKTERWAFDTIEDLVKIIEDFKQKAGI